MAKNHLSYQEMTNLGGFYTPQKFVDHLIEKLHKNIKCLKNYCFIDSSCGYGTFLAPLAKYKTIGCDIDLKAVEVATQNCPDTKFFVKNTLCDFSREYMGLTEEDKLILLGNPPYNDTTSMVKNSIKDTAPCSIDPDLKTRDLGISFLLSFNKLKADYVAVLHPLSYMIKKTNFDLLKSFYSNYTLIDHSVINSQEFSSTSKTKGFPIIIALYKRQEGGMTYEDVLNTTFRSFEGNCFTLKTDSIKNYIKKYPTKDAVCTNEDILFYTLRDINALNRSRTFIKEKIDNAIVIDKSKFHYYCYVDVFKNYIKDLPYYYGNTDVFIDNTAFLRIKDVFVTKSLEAHPWLKDKVEDFKFNDNYSLIDDYFKKLFASKEAGGIEIADHTVKIPLPLTSVTGKTRIKKRSSLSEYGIPVATKREPITEDCYIEWQIGYDVITSDKAKLKATTLSDLRFMGANGNEKALYELSEYIKIFYDWSLISKESLLAIKDHLLSLKDTDLLESNPTFGIKRSDFSVTAFNGFDFSVSEVKYPLLIYNFKDSPLYVETVIREKQYAVGIQPMLYLCLPISCLDGAHKLLGRTAASKETATFSVTADNVNVFCELLCLFGTLSRNHNKDVISIIDTILDLG